MRQVSLHSSILPVHLSDIMRLCHPAAPPTRWLGAAAASLYAGLVSVCAFAVIIQAFKTEPALLAFLWNCRWIVWNGFITSHPRKMFPSWTKKQLFSFGFVMWNGRHHDCSAQLSAQVLPALLQRDSLLAACKKVPVDIICWFAYNTISVSLLRINVWSFAAYRQRCNDNSIDLQSKWCTLTSVSSSIPNSSRHINSAACACWSKLSIQSGYILLNVATESSSWQQFVWKTQTGLKMRPVCEAVILSC